MPGAVTAQCSRRRSTSGKGRRWVVWWTALGCAAGCLVGGCRTRTGAKGSGALAEVVGDGGGPARPFGLTSEQAAQVLARVGARTITLGDFAATLDRMDQFDQLRYQSLERRKELLEEMVDVELLAEDARKMRLDQTPEAQQALRQILRDALLARVRSEAGTPAEVPEETVRAYYEAHRQEFREPERRRVAHIVVRDRDVAQRVLAEAKAASGTEWGELVLKHSLDQPPKGAARPPLELLGDLGIVGAPSDPRGDNPRVPSAIRQVVFEIGAIGEVFPRPIEDQGRFHLVRMTGKSEARDRSLADSERTIRVSIVQAKIAERERLLEAQLRQEFPVTIDEQALSVVEGQAKVAVDGGMALPASGGIPDSGY